ncbi:bacterial regulatory helix-turn-helix, lysR family protein [Collimonas arenae]|uniref:LysR family transcriptional regulator n=1 Tax=Collimonas arenae TaxID=279058 RepID=UPI0007788524|nr:LysR family transcriptional regulator [Collimonas arenae]AMO99494.1 bacterial regulatory helix-turn-helix, lysR family protein [Collimonas arenae]
MDSLSGIVSFVKTAEALSFVAAARALGVSASAVGKNVAKLEQTVGVRLFQRSTRRVHLTTEGELFYQRCRSILDDLQDAESMLSHAVEAPRGKLRVGVPTIGYRFLLPVLPEFRRLYPEVELDVDFNDQLVDVIEDGFDVVIRSGNLPDSKLMSRRIGAFRFVLCAAPAYLERKGVPHIPSDLEQHDCLRYRFLTTGKLMDWTMSADPVWSQLRLPSMLTFNNMEAVFTAAIDGHGIAYVPDFLAQKAVSEKLLQIVLDDYQLDRGQFWALWPSNRQLSPKIRVFVDFISTRLFAQDFHTP